MAIAQLFGIPHNNTVATSFIACYLQSKVVLDIKPMWIDCHMLSSLFATGYMSGGESCAAATADILLLVLQ